MATEQIPTDLIADDAVSTDKIANDASISTSGNITTTGSGTLTVAGTSTLTGALTASGGITNAGTISAGTLGANVAFNDAHKDIRIEDSIQLALTTATSITSSFLVSTSAIWTEMWKGSGITHPYHPSSTAEYGKFKVGKAGLYLVWYDLHNDGTTNTTAELFLLVNGHYINNSNVTANNRAGAKTRSYISNADEIAFPSHGACIFAIPLDANDSLTVYGSGAFYGEADSPMGMYGAIRIGGH